MKAKIRKEYECANSLFEELCQLFTPKEVLNEMIKVMDAYTLAEILEGVVDNWGIDVDEYGNIIGGLDEDE